MHTPRPAALAAIALLALSIAGCGGAAAPTPVPSTAPTTAPVATPAATPVAVRFEVALADMLTMTPAAMTVPVGVPVTFVVTNGGTVLHEFVLGDETAQADHETEMQQAGGMSMPVDEPMAIGVEPGKTKEITVTFDKAGTVFAGCHVAGHWLAGMKSVISVE